MVREGAYLIFPETWIDMTLSQFCNTCICQSLRRILYASRPAA